MAAATASDIVQVTESSYAQFAKDNDAFVISFTAPWCGHSRALKPEYEKLAAQLQSQWEWVGGAVAKFQVQQEARAGWLRATVRGARAVERTFGFDSRRSPPRLAKLTLLTVIRLF